MKKLILVFSLGLAACDSGSGSPARTESTPSGPTSSAGRPEGAALDLPSGTVPGAGLVSLEARDPAGFRGEAIAGKVWSVRVDGAEHVAFPRPVLLRIPYDPTRIPEGMFVTLSFREGDHWRPVAGAVADAASKTVSARITHLSEYAPTLTAADIEVTARWYGTFIMAFQDSDFPVGPPNYMLSGMSKMETAKIVVREEVLRGSSPDEKCRYVVESASVHISYGGRIATVKDATYKSLDPLSVTVTKHGQDLEEPMPPEYVARCTAQRAIVDDRRATVAAAERELDRAPSRARAEFALKELRERLADAVGTLRHLEFDGYTSKTHFEAGWSGEEAWANANIAHPGFEYEEAQWHLEFEPFGLPKGQGKRVLTKKSLDRSIGARGRRGALLTSSESGGEGGRRWDKTTTFVRAPLDGTAEAHEVVVRGQVLHRLLAGGPAGSDLFIGQRNGQDPADIAARGIPAAGQALVEAFLLEYPDPAVGPPAGSRVARATTGTRGEFELKFSAKPEQVLQLRTTWRNEEAQLEEQQDVEVPLCLPWLIASTLDGAGPFVPLPAITRRGVAIARFTGRPTLFGLGSEVRGGRMKSTGARKLEMEFTGADAILLGTFCLRATHLNQNLNTIRLDVRPREDEITAACPPDTLPAVLGRLRGAQVGAVVPVEFAGHELCYLVSTLVALESIGLETIVRNEDGVSPGILGLAQRIYDEMDARAVDAARRPRFTWAAPDLAADWPFVAANAHDENEHWLLSIRGGDGDRWRAWQDPDLLKSALEALYPLIRIEIVGEDLFTEAARESFLRRLAGGAAGVCRIGHLSAGRELGHVLAFLGVVLDSRGRPVRTIFHDPYGDLSGHPEISGYYGAPRDRDDTGHDGAYAPYGLAPRATSGFNGTLRSQRYLSYVNSSAATTATALRARLLPGIVR